MELITYLDKQKLGEINLFTLNSHNFNLEIFLEFQNFHLITCPCINCVRRVNVVVVTLM